MQVSGDLSPGLMARAQLTIRFRKDRGGWEVDYRDIDGARRRPLFLTEEAAHEFATGVFRRAGQPLPAIQDREVTLRDYAARWLAVVEADRAPNTYRSYAERLKRHVLPALGHLKLRSVHRSHIKAFLAEKRRQGHSKNSVRLMKAPLSVLLSEAVDDGIIPVNPALQLGCRLGARADKLTHAERVQRIRPMMWAQRQAFLDEASAERRHFALFATLLYAGLRPGEGFALRPAMSTSPNVDPCGARVEPGTGEGHEDPRPPHRGYESGPHRDPPRAPDVAQGGSGAARLGAAPMALSKRGRPADG
jgi:hypothetical protein